MSEPQVKSIYDQMCALVRNDFQLRKLTIDATIDIVTRLIKIAESIIGLKGAQKKELVMNVLQLIFQTFGGDLAVAEFVYHTATFVIDQFVAIYNAGDAWMRSPSRWQRLKAKCRCCCC